MERGGIAAESCSRFVHIGCIAARYSGHAACGGTRGSNCGRGWVSSGEHPFTITNGHAPGENGRFYFKNFLTGCIHSVLRRRSRRSQ